MEMMSNVAKLVEGSDVCPPKCPYSVIISSYPHCILFDWWLEDDMDGKYPRCSKCLKLFDSKLRKEDKQWIPEEA